MNRLAILAATGVLALMLTACGEDKNSTKPQENTAPAEQVQGGEKPADNAPAAPTAPAAPEQEKSSTETQGN